MGTHHPEKIGRTRRLGGWLAGLVVVVALAGAGACGSPPVKSTQPVTSRAPATTAFTEYIAPSTTETTVAPTTTAPPTTTTPPTTAAPTTVRTTTPPTTAQTLSNSNTYVNSAGDTIQSPASTSDGQAPAGATAQCADGTYSFSQTRSGTCSHHGGVSTWL